MILGTHSWHQQFKVSAEFGESSNIQIFPLSFRTNGESPQNDLFLTFLLLPSLNPNADTENTHI